MLATFFHPKIKLREMEKIDVIEFRHCNETIPNIHNKLVKHNFV